MNYIAYLRRSTNIQDTSFASQLEAIQTVVAGSGGTILEVIEETESGKCVTRPGLARALQLCRKHGATLIVKDMSRLGRNLKQIVNILSDGTPCRFSTLPMQTPTILLQIMAAFSEWEGAQISARTKAGLAVVKARGTKLGNPKLAEARTKAQQAIRSNRTEYLKEIQPMIRQLRNEGMKWSSICDKLNGLGIRTRNGCSWTTGSAYQAAR